MSTYRGIKVTENNLHVENRKSQPGVYRGVKHDAIESDKSDKAQDGCIPWRQAFCLTTR